MTPPPDPFSGLGNALRHAFVLPLDHRASPDLDALLDRLSEREARPTH